jgi:hypothetical protein
MPGTFQTALPRAFGTEVSGISFFRAKPRATAARPIADGRGA